jgi:hypothetical protein
MYRLRRSEKLTGTADIARIKDFGTQTTLPSDTSRLLGCRTIFTEPDMVLTLRPRWKTFDDYLASMTSGYRNNTKKLFKDCANAGIIFRTISADEILTRHNDIQALYQRGCKKTIAHAVTERFGGYPNHSLAFDRGVGAVLMR